MTPDLNMNKMVKHCRCCNTTKPVSKFYKNRTRKDGLSVRCGECERESVRKYQAAQPEKVHEAFRKWAAANPEKRRASYQRRRASKASATPPWETSAALTDHERSRWVFASLHCVNESEVHLDHIIPLCAARTANGNRQRVASGLHCVDNLTWKLGRENCSKGASLDHAEAELSESPTFEQVTYIIFRKYGTGAHP